jgi:hypothetical protein
LTAAFTLIFVSEIGDKVTSLQLKLFKCQLILCPWDFFWYMFSNLLCSVHHLLYFIEVLHTMARWLDFFKVFILPFLLVEVCQKSFFLIQILP